MIPKYVLKHVTSPPEKNILEHIKGCGFERRLLKVSKGFQLPSSGIIMPWRRRLPVRHSPHYRIALRHTDAAAVLLPRGAMQDC